MERSGQSHGKTKRYSIINFNYLIRLPACIGLISSSKIVLCNFCSWCTWSPLWCKLISIFLAFLSLKRINFGVVALDKLSR